MDCRLTIIPGCKNKYKVIYNSVQFHLDSGRQAVVVKLINKHALPCVCVNEEISYRTAYFASFPP